MSILGDRHSYAEEVRRPSSASDDYDASSFGSSDSSSRSHSSYSDFSEDDEWQRDVDANGELFFVRAAAEREPTAGESSGHVASHLQLSPPSSKGNSGKFPVRLRWRHKQVDEGLVSGAQSIRNGGQIRSDPRPARHYTEVILTVNDKQPNLGRRSSQLELLLGIIPARITSPPGLKDKISPPDSVSVRALVPGTQASRDGNIRIGDVIHKIQESEVTWSNLDQVLSHLVSQQVKLTLATQTTAALPANKSSADGGNVFYKKSSEIFFPKLLTGKDDDLKTLLLTSRGQTLTQPHGILYLALSNSDSTELNEDILYQYPTTANRLVPIRGALFTINHVVPEVFGSPPASSSILVDAQLVHVCYAREGKEVLLLAMPADSATVYHLTELTSQVVRSLTFQYKTLHNCFTEKSHLGGLNHFFTLFFLSNMQKISSSEVMPFKDRPFFKFFGFPQFLSLPVDLQCCISEILSELESSDFADLSEDHYEMRRLYNVLGTLLFYKGYLVSSHLSSDDIGCISLYLEGSGLLETSRGTPWSQVIVWREVHRSWVLEKDRRWFLLVVGRNHCLVAALLEAGGCSMRAIGPQGPDPFYVEQCRSALIQLEVRQVPSLLNSWLDWPLTPLLTSAESMAFMQCGKVPKVSGIPERLADQIATSKGLSASKLSLGSLSSWHQVHPEGNATSPKKGTLAIGETDSDTTSVSLTASGTSDDMTPILGRRERREDSDRRQSWSDANSQDDEDVAAGFAKSGAGQRYLPSVLDLANIGENLPSTTTRDRNFAPQKLTVGPHNVLFHYVHLDSSDGVLVCPTRNLSIGQELNAEVMENFKSACLTIQKTLKSQFALQQKEITVENETHDSYVENGMLFTVAPLPSIISKGSGNGPLTYWVVGRIFSRNFLTKELYVCYHDSCPQITVEMAFQLVFGLSI